MAHVVLPRPARPIRSARAFSIESFTARRPREGGDPVSLLLIQEKKPVDDQRFALLKDSFRFRGNDGTEASRSKML